MISWFLLFTWCFFPNKATHTLKVQVSGCPSDKGYANVALFNSSSAFPSYGKQYKGTIVTVKDGNCLVSFSDLPAGTYAVAVFHDENGNQKLDKNLFGAPTEAYGFSRNARGTFSAPSFEECQVSLSNDRQINITVK